MIETENRIKILETTVQQLIKDNRQLVFQVERLALTLAEIWSGVEYYAVTQDAVCEVFELTAEQIAGEFPGAWIKRNPKGVEQLIFGKNEQEFLANKICQARVIICCMHRYVFRNKRRTQGELSATYPFYAARQEYTLRDIFDKILKREGPYASLYDKFERVRVLIQEKISE